MPQIIELPRYISVNLAKKTSVAQKKNFYSSFAPFPISYLLEEKKDNLTEWVVKITKKARTKTYYLTISGHLYQEWIQSYFEASRVDQDLIMDVISSIILSEEGVKKVELFRYSNNILHPFKVFYRREPSEAGIEDEFFVTEVNYLNNDPAGEYGQNLMIYTMRDVFVFGYPGYYSDGNLLCEGFAWGDELSQVLLDVTGETEVNEDTLHELFSELVFHDEDTLLSAPLSEVLDPLVFLEEYVPELSPTLKKSE